jgi:hypothetical protein
VKILLASVALALAVYQLVLIAVGYGKLRPPFLGGLNGFARHRYIRLASLFHFWIGNEPCLKASSKS